MTTLLYLLVKHSDWQDFVMRARLYRGPLQVQVESALYQLPRHFLSQPQLPDVDFNGHEYALDILEIMSMAEYDVYFKTILAFHILALRTPCNSQPVLNVPQLKYSQPQV